METIELVKNYKKKIYLNVRMDYRFCTSNNPKSVPTLQTSVDLTVNPRVSFNCKRITNTKEEKTMTVVLLVDLRSVRTLPGRGTPGPRRTCSDQTLFVDQRRLTSTKTG